MTRRNLLRGIGALGASLARLPAASGKLNFVFLLADDLGWTDVASYGSSFYETPNLDRLASQGMRFTNAYAACPVCSPTRASIMTGKYPARLRLTNFIPGQHYLPYSPVLPPKFRQELPLQEVTLPEALKPAAYASAAIGKWHLGGKGFLPEDQGFSLGYEVGRTPGVASRFFNPGWTGQPPTRGAEGDYLPDHLTDRALDFLDNNKESPFLLYLAFHVPHIPIEGKQAYIEKFKPKVKPGAVPGRDHHNPVYASMIYSLDENVGRLMKKLDQLRLAENTVFIFTSDNGGLTAPEFRNEPVTSNLPLREGKGHVYEGGIRVPLIVRWPSAVKAGARSDTPVISNDFFPTMLDLAGVPAPHAVDGVSVTPLLKQSGRLAPRDLYWHYPHYSNQLGRPGGALRRGDWKLIEFYDDSSIELYNLAEDIGEHNNLASKLPETAAQLKQALHAWRKSVGADLVVPNPDYDPARSGLRVRPGQAAPKK